MQPPKQQALPGNLALHVDPTGSHASTSLERNSTDAAKVRRIEEVSALKFIVYKIC